MSLNENTTEYTNVGLCFDTFKEKLGDIAFTMTDQEIKYLMELQEQVADAIFDVWLNKENEVKVLK